MKFKKGCYVKIISSCSFPEHMGKVGQIIRSRSKKYIDIELYKISTTNKVWFSDGCLKKLETKEEALAEAL